MRIRLLSEVGKKTWDAFVKAQDEGTFFHLSGWSDVMQEALRHRVNFLAAEQDGALVGVLPLVNVKSALFGNSVISNAFCVYGGPLVSEPEALSALDEAAWDWTRKCGADHLEYRCRKPLHPDWPCKDDLYVTFRREIDPDPEVNMKAIPRKQRAMVRKGIKAGLSAEVGRDVDCFFQMYATSVRNLGTPVFPKKLFRTLLDVFGEDCDVLTVIHDGTPVSSVLSFYFREEVLPYYGGGTFAARAVAANDYMYWALMEYAREHRGAGLFDFGRSKTGTGAFSFKKNWGFEPEPLYYEHRLAKGDEIPEVNPLNPKYQAMIKVWKRLPLPIANRLGPVVSRNLG